MKSPRLLRRIACVFLAVCLLCMTAFSASAEDIRYEFPDTEEETITAPSAMMLYFGIRPEDDVVLYEKEADARYQPGSLMRVAMLGYAMKVIGEQELDIDTETASYSLYLFNHYVAGTGLGTAEMKFGETWTLRDLLTLCALQTSADCAVTLAEKLSGTPEAFVEGLNAFAAALGCTNSHFTNAMGLNDEGQYMSARDVVTFLRYAMQYTEVYDMLALTDWTVKPVSGGSKRSWPTSNDMLRASQKPFYQYATGGRTGGTLTESSLVEYGSYKGYDYMAVVMGAERKDEKGKLTHIAYKEAKSLIRWGFLNFSHVTLLHKDVPVDRIDVLNAKSDEGVKLAPAKDLFTVAPNGTDISKITREITYTKQQYAAPIKKGEVLGTIVLYFEGKEIGRTDLVAGEDAPYSALRAAWKTIRSVIFSWWTLAFVVLIILLIVGYVLLTIRYNRRRNKTWKS